MTEALDHKIVSENERIESRKELAMSKSSMRQYQLLLHLESLFYF